MRLFARLLLVLLSISTALTAVGVSFAPVPVAMAQPIAQDVPTVDEDSPGEPASSADPNYGAWSLVAVCLILAGMLLVTVEKWAARRIPADVSSG